MDDMRLKFYNPVVTGAPGVSIPRTNVHSTTADSGGNASFQEILQKDLEETSEVSFSKHAVKRVMDHNLSLSQDSLARLNEGVKLANEKNLDDTLILVDQNAFLVSAKNNTVITAFGGSDMKGNVFTNIDGTVVV
ncbi:MAG: flagellar protein [Faecalibacterium sp.]|jgi:flagellar operon protein|nr:flagellar protein [Faecalibacterium sp.]